MGRPSKTAADELQEHAAGRMFRKVAMESTKRL